MENFYTQKDEVRVYGGRIAIIELVVYKIVNGKETNEIYCYEASIDGESGYIIYPNEIEQ